MAYAYCQHPGCENGLAEPTPKNAILGWLCRDDHENELPGDQRDWRLWTLWDKVSELERKAEEASLF